MELNIEFTNSALYIVILLAVGLFVLFRFLSWLLPLLLLRREKRRKAWRYTSLIELFVWVVFTIWSVNYLSGNNQLYAIGLFLILFAFTVYAAWVGLKDFVAGAIFKTSGNFSLNETIRIGEYTGKIIRFGHTSAVLETEAGETIFIPYSYLFGKVIVKSHPAETILSYTFRIEIPTGQAVPDIVEQIRSEILGMPWASLKKDPQIKPAGDTRQGHLLEITVFSIEKAYFHEMENLIKEKFVHPDTTGDAETTVS